MHYYIQYGAQFSFKLMNPNTDQDKALFRDLGILMPQDDTDVTISDAYVTPPSI